MAFIFHEEAQPYYEAYVLLSNLMNQTTPEPFRAQLIKAGLKREASLLLDDILALYQKAAEKMQPYDAKLVNLFKSWRENESAMTGSDILTYAYLPDKLGHMQQAMGALPEEERKRQVFWGIATALGETEAAKRYGGAFLVQLLESAGLNDNWKYHILWLYHCATEAAELLQSALDQMVEMMAEPLGDLHPHDVETIRKLRRIPDFGEYVLKEVGIRLPENEDVHVYPSAILLGVAPVLNHEGAPERPVSILWGSRFLDAQRLSKVTKSLPTNAGDVLRCLSEKTKFEILLALREQPYYGGELAELLHLKPATVSHHMNELLKNDLVTVDPRQNRLYYSIHSSRVREVLMETLGLF